MFVNLLILVVGVLHLGAPKRPGGQGRGVQQSEEEAANMMYSQMFEAQGMEREMSFEALAQLDLNNAPQFQSLERPDDVEMAYDVKMAYDVEMPTVGGPNFGGPGIGGTSIGRCPMVRCHMTFVVVMDSSGSIGKPNYRKMLDFVKKTLKILKVKAYRNGITVCTGIVTYADEAHLEVDPCCENDICQVVGRVNHKIISYIGRGTNTNDGLTVAREALSGTSSWARTAWLITDGYSNIGGDPVPMAEQMRNERINIIAIGITNDVNDVEIAGITGRSPNPKVESFNRLVEVIAMLLRVSLTTEGQLDTEFKSACHDYGLHKYVEECGADCEWTEWGICRETESWWQCERSRLCVAQSGHVVHRDSEDCWCDVGGYEDPVDFSGDDWFG